MRRRDGFGNWQDHRARFRTLTTYDARQLQHFVSGELSRLLKHAFETVPYYHEMWTAGGFAPTDHVTVADLAHLPLLTKDIIRSQKADLVSGRFSTAGLDVDFTGGTVGNQTEFYRDRASGIAKLGRQWGILER